MLFMVQISFQGVSSIFRPFNSGLMPSVLTFENLCPVLSVNFVLQLYLNLISQFQDADNLSMECFQALTVVFIYKSIQEKNQFD